MARTRRNSDPATFGRLFMIIGLVTAVVFVATAVVVGVVQGQRTADWATTTGTITGNQESIDVDSNNRRRGTRTQTVHQAQVTYSVGGREYTVTTGMKTSGRHELGRQMQIRYDPADPSQAEGEGETNLVLLLVGGIGGLIGLPFFGIGFLMRRSGRSGRSGRPA